MRRYLFLALALVATGAWAEERYTNADLDRIYVPGAYTNEDLKALPPIAMQEAPAMPLATTIIDTSERDFLFAQLEALEARRSAFARSLAYEKARLWTAYGPGGNDPNDYPVPGFRSRSRLFRASLRKQIAMLDKEIEDARWRAVRAPVTYLP
ncbi:MAG: hypothetical protein V3U98_05235 [Acidobacteriota bacterium]